MTQLHCIFKQQRCNRYKTLTSMLSKAYHKSLHSLYPLISVVLEPIPTVLGREAGYTLYRPTVYHRGFLSQMCGGIAVVPGTHSLVCDDNSESYGNVCFLYLYPLQKNMDAKWSMVKLLAPHWNHLAPTTKRHTNVSCLPCFNFKMMTIGIFICKTLLNKHLAYISSHKTSNITSPHSCS